jgi:aminoglycoside phosphotransferase (APT) family kinase protein
MKMRTVDQESLANWLDGQGLEPGRPTTVETLAGGTSNIMLSIDRGSSHWVLRRPTAVAVSRANEGMRREYAILNALRDSDVPHPDAVAFCEDQSVLGCSFFLMEHVDGVNPVPLPASFNNDAYREGIAFAMVDALCKVHMFDWESSELRTIGHPEHFHERQVDRWSKQLASYGGRELPGMDHVTSWLDAHRPSHFVPGLMHGDFHMLNTLIAKEPPARVLAIVDWETATIGDPFLDLAGFLEVWLAATGPGWPDRDALVETYARERDLTEMPDLTYYRVLYHFRLAVLVEGIYQRSLNDPHRVDEDEMGDRVLQSMGRAVALSSVQTDG